MQLHLWRSNVTFTGETYDVQFKDYQGVKPEDVPAFKASFNAPSHKDCPLPCAGQ